MTKAEFLVSALESLDDNICFDKLTLDFNAFDYYSARHGSLTGNRICAEYNWNTSAK